MDYKDILDVYDICQQDRYVVYFYLIYENTLDINNFKTYIKKLSQNENKYLENNILDIHDRQHKRYSKQYEFIYEMYKRKDLSMFEDDYIDEFKNQLPIISRDDEKYIFEDIKDYNKKYYMFQKYLHHNYDPSYDDIVSAKKKMPCQII